MGAWGHLGITMGTGRGPMVDFRWIFGSRVGPEKTPNPFNLAHFFDMVSQQCQRQCGNALWEDLGPAVDAQMWLKCCK